MRSALQTTRAVAAAAVAAAAAVEWQLGRAAPQAAPFVVAGTEAVGHTPGHNKRNWDGRFTGS